MAYNWNGEFSNHRRSQFLAQTTLGLSALAFIVVISVMAYFVGSLGIIDAVGSLSVHEWQLRLN